MKLTIEISTCDHGLTTDWLTGKIVPLRTRTITHTLETAYIYGAAAPRAYARRILEDGQ